ncbi:endolytic transglycosylase MltG [Wenzhouxiangella marina]|uniref:Endolytic murein transglycosylase n=1 Tax=Wenzhouxiangella marina TaxID=1579979 RepID=A0A0K0XWF4_9GAMM|nr:endolytic transglycosylase MltG [Wenzhouxiangella marina]AKS41946.1 Putative membrane protein [Wenzhouxiangella marina]MBB6086287.1 UPF0755 protein [Wenzhouxiangella marina]
MRRLISVFLLFLLLAAGVTAWQWSAWRDFLQSPVNPDGPVALWIAPGTSFGGLVRQFEALGLARPDWRWRLYGRLHRPGLQVGEFLIDANQTLPALLARLESGRVREHRWTLVEGWTLRQMRADLADDPRLRHESRGMDTEALMAALDCAGCEAEGRFLPETYFFIRGSSDLDLLQRAHEAMDRALADAWARRDPELPIDSPEELLILASLIERETGDPSERAQVAGVFKRRLERGMRLQTDPTVIYGLGEGFDGRLRRVHLRTDHPWNTYTRHGLPVTPIAMPGRASLEAAARPADGTALYFVAKGDGTHQFSDTLDQHNAAVDRYIRGR